MTKKQTALDDANRAMSEMTFEAQRRSIEDLTAQCDLLKAQALAVRDEVATVTARANRAEVDRLQMKETVAQLRAENSRLLRMFTGVRNAFLAATEGDALGRPLP